MEERKEVWLFGLSHHCSFCGFVYYHYVLLALVFAWRGRLADGVAGQRRWVLPPLPLMVWGFRGRCGRQLRAGRRPSFARSQCTCNFSVFHLYSSAARARCALLAALRRTLYLRTNGMVSPGERGTYLSQNGRCYVGAFGWYGFVRAGRPSRCAAEHYAAAAALRRACTI